MLLFLPGLICDARTFAAQTAAFADSRAIEGYGLADSLPAMAEIVLEQVQLPDGRSVYRSRPLDKPGVYTLSTGSRTIPVAVNVPDDEADIRPLDAAAIRNALGEIEMGTFDDQLPTLAETQQPASDFGWSVMLIVLGLVALESFLAMRFGHYRR